jgi:hypothetical protein
MNTITPTCWWTCLLIVHGDSLLNLAKQPSSSIRIPGAREKVWWNEHALFCNSTPASKCLVLISLNVLSIRMPCSELWRFQSNSCFLIRSNDFFSLPTAGDLRSNSSFSSPRMKQCQRIHEKWLQRRGRASGRRRCTVPPAEQVEATEEQDKSKQQIQTLFLCWTDYVLWCWTRLKDGLISCVIVRYNFWTI